MDASLPPVPTVELPALRRLQAVTQEELAARLDIAQSNVSRLERRPDMLIGTLKRLVEALGGELRLVAAFPAGSLYIGGLGETAGPSERAEGRGGASVADGLGRYFRAQPTAGVVSAYLFGSVAEGRDHAESDVDVGVLLDRDVHPTAADRSDARVALGSDLVHALGRNDVDLVVLNDAPPGLARRVVVEGTRVACFDEAVDHAFVRDAQLRAADIAPFLARMRRIKLDALRA